jgi:penicillin-binding protein 2
MAFSSSKQRHISRRAVFFGGLQLAALSTLAGRLYYLQFVKSETLTTQAENNRIKLQLMPPARGMIVDRVGTPLAVNERNYQLFLDVTALKKQEIDHILNEVEQMVGLGKDTKEDVLKEIKKRRFPPPILLKEHMEWETVAKLELNALSLAGTYIYTGQQRHYPLKDATAHLVGYIGRVAPEELDKKDEPLMRLPDFKIGKNGVERMYNDALIGQAGIRQLEVDAEGLVVRELKSQQSVAGATTTLTIHAGLQQYIANLTRNESASVVVMDVRNGDILAMVSMPGFDPDIFSRAIPADYWKQLQENERNPLMNKAVQGQYPPGSTFKMLVGLAALEAEIAKENTRVHCPGHYYLGNHRFNCWKEGGHGSVDLKQAIAVSCDTYFYTMAQRLGIQPIADMARRFGFGDNHALGFPGEQSGIVPDEAWKMKAYKQKWQTGDTVNVGIGQGYVLATPLQMCVMTARLVGGGYAITPRLTAEVSVPEFAALNVSEDHLSLVKAGMDAAVNSPIGTAYGKRITQQGLEMGGKTGTSQVKRITQRGLDQSKLPWKDRHHAFFVGYAPVEHPRFVCCVAVEHGGGGSAAAAPIARDVLLYVQGLGI